MEQFTQKWKIAENVLNIGPSNKSCHITFSSKKVISSESEEKNAQIKHCLQVETNTNRHVGGFWWEDKSCCFFRWRKCYRVWTHILARDNRWKLKALMIDLFLTNTQLSLNKRLIDVLESCELLVDYSNIFIRCLNSLQRIHWWANAKYPMKKQTYLGWPNSV